MRGPAGGAVAGALGPGTAWLETLGRQDHFFPPHLPGVVSPVSLGVTRGWGREKPLGSLWKQRLEAWPFLLQVLTPFTSLGPLFSQLSLGTESYLPGASISPAEPAQHGTYDNVLWRPRLPESKSHFPCSGFLNA